MLTNIKKTSSFSGWRGDKENKDCVQVKFNENTGLVEVTDSKQPDTQEPKVFTTSEWRAFIAGVKAGEFDLLSGE